MDTYLYIIIIITLSIFMIFYGGHNNQTKIEYESNYFSSLNSIIIFEKKLNKLNKDDIFINNNFINVNSYLKNLHILIPNFVNCFFIKILPYSIFDIFNIVEKQDIKTHMMIIFNHKKHNNLELLINTEKSNIIKKNTKSENIHPYSTNGYFYDLEKVISITGIYHIYNNSNEQVNITCFILKKPFWHI